MRKMVFGRQFSRGRKGRIALLRSLVRAIVLNGKIITTKAKAKAIQKDIDKYIKKAKENTVAARRKVLAEMGNDKETVNAIFMKVSPSFMERKSGFTKITLLPQRKGDASKMVRLEWSGKIVEIKEEKKETKKEVNKEVNKKEQKKEKKDR